jgi:hypothetical protein
MIGRRHHHIGIIRIDAPDHFALSRFSRHDCKSVIKSGKRTGASIEVQTALFVVASLSLFVVRSVTGVTLVRKDWTHIAAKVDVRRDTRVRSRYYGQQKGPSLSAHVKSDVMPAGPDHRVQNMGRSRTRGVSAVKQVWQFNADTSVGVVKMITPCVRTSY